MNNPFLLAALVIACQMILLWLISIPLRNVSIIDIGWGIGFVLVAWIVSWNDLLMLMVTAWGIRLAYYLTVRNLGKPEDYRYAAMRQKHGSSFVWSSLFRVFALQGVIMWIVALPIVTTTVRISVDQPDAVATRSDLILAAIVVGTGLLLWLVGMIFETVSDWQLWEFKSKSWNDGKVMDSGLWKYTRHPNYFGEFLIWWGHWLVSLAMTDPTRTWWTIISPALMTFLLLKVSGVALLERAMEKRSPEYESYIKRTSKFFPRPPMQNSSIEGTSVS
jgi:steroid 5-alpha reductase family enzyme